MTTHTKADLIKRVMRDLGLISAEEQPSAEDSALVEQSITSVASLLAAKGVKIWNGSDVVIPDEYLTPLSHRVAISVAPAFGLGTIADSLSAIREAERELRILSAKAATGSVAEAEYF